MCNCNKEHSQEKPCDMPTYCGPDIIKRAFVESKDYGNQLILIMEYGEGDARFRVAEKITADAIRKLKASLAKVEL